MIKIALIAGLGGFAGTALRFLISRSLADQSVSPFPFGTFIVNLAGCFLIGILMGLSERGNLLSQEWRVFLTVGFCGGFTTFSAFASENINLLKEGQFLMLCLYTGLSLFIGLLLTWLGLMGVKSLFP